MTKITYREANGTDYVRDVADGLSVMRGALDEKVTEVYRFYTVPASNTAVGHIILENGVKTAKKATPNKAKAKKPTRKAA